MRVIDLANAITFKCEKCGEETVTNAPIVTVGCLKPKCQKAKVSFNVDIVRSPYKKELWQNCPANVPFEVGYLDGTIMSRIYEIKKADSSQVTIVPESIAQFVKKENPYHARLKKPTK
jgi:hypothetical protein